jgi:hypothetical protein
MGQSQRRVEEGGFEGGGVGGKIASISQRQFLSGCLKFGQISHWVAFHFPMG